jgi:hypothetical protein
VSGSSSGAEPRRARGLPLRPLAALLAVAHGGWIWWLSSQSFQGEGGPFWSFVGNSVHLALFGLLAVLILEACRRDGGWTRRALLVSLMVTVAYGVVDELHQASTPGRSPDPADVCVDLLGAVGAIALWWGARGRGRIGVAFARSFGVVAVALAFNAWRAWGRELGLRS